MLQSKNIIIGISGSIAAYKIAILLRLLVKAGANVKVIMTESATAFISPLTLSTLSKNKVHTQIIEQDSWDNHVELGLWADLMIIAPATANTIAKMANGICDNLLVATYLSAKCPVYFAPAMDLDMWKHRSTIRNIQLLKSYNNIEIPSEFGELASGLVGMGRMAEPEHIVSFLNNELEKNTQLKGKNILITAGPTYEPIDPVRFIGNRSTGKMGIAIAEVAAKRGAKVTLVLGPTQLTVKNPAIAVVSVGTAQEMYDAVTSRKEKADVLILSAAVADYTPVTVATQKIKKKEAQFNVALTKTKDIAASVGADKKANQIIIGFALETENEETNAIEKLQRKNMDYIVLNSLNEKGAGFGFDTNKINIYNKDGLFVKYDLLPKNEVAEKIIDLI
jgi:phosphopantothenoylcysteine decarboxylase/phosphopantothenate--cysteine ligase